MSSSAMGIGEDDIRAVLAQIPYAQTLGIAPLLMGDELTLIMPYKPEIIGNPMLQALHGGAVGAFLETTAMVQVGLMEELALPRPIGINLDYLRRGQPRDTYARAIIAKRGSRVANVRVRAWQASYDEPISILHGHFMLSQKSEK